MPTTVSEILGAQAAPITFEHKGKVYRPKLLVQKLKSAVERAVQDHAKRTLVEMAGQVPDAVLGIALAGHAKEVAAGTYRYGSPACRDWLASPDGILGFAALVFGCSPDEMTMLLTERGPEVAQILEQVIHESLPPDVLARLEEARRQEQTPQEQAPQEEASAEDPLPVG